MDATLPNSLRSPAVPVVGISCCRNADEAFPRHSVGEKYVTAITDAVGAVPMLIPALGNRLAVDATLGAVDGLFVTGSPSNVEPHHYAGGPEPANNATDPARDTTVLALIRGAIALGVPLFAVCRGIQELNVALGGTLHQELHAVSGRFDHRSDKSRPPSERYGDRHAIHLTPGGVLHRLLGAERLQVNSLHGQGLDTVAPGLAVEARAEDDTIEAVSVTDAPAFALAVQWHPEFKPLSNRASSLLFRAFAEACAERAVERRAARVD
ncbi:MAG: gamma-glutamyl-gamma-aminobutyrate hydrolase family protein [Pseudomonadota bacterium]